MNIILKHLPEIITVVWNTDGVGDAWWTDTDISPTGVLVVQNLSVENMPPAFMAQSLSLACFPPPSVSGWLFLF